MNKNVIITEKKSNNVSIVREQLKKDLKYVIKLNVNFKATKFQIDIYM